MRRASSLPAGSSEREINMDVAVLGRVRSGRHAVSGGLARALVLQLALCALCFYAGRNSWVVSQVPTTRLTLRQSPERGEEALNRQEFHELHGELDDLRAELRVALLQKGRAAVDGEPEAESKPSADLAISIQASQGHLGHLEDLLRALAHPAIAIMVHLDAKAPDTEHEELTQLLDAIRCVAGNQPGTFASLEALSPAQAISYRGISMVDVTLRVLEHMVAHVTGWRFFLNLSARDYPLLRANELVALAAELPPDANFIDTNYESHFSQIFSRVTNVAVDDSMFRNDGDFRVHDFSSLRRRYPNTFRPYHGEAWTMLSAPFARYIATNADGLPRRMFTFYANAVSSAEAYFQTLLCASSYADTLINDCLRYVDWSIPNMQHPADIGPGHLPKLRAAGALFARKFTDRSVTEAVRREVLRLGVADSSVGLDAIRARIAGANRTCATGVWEGPRSLTMLRRINAAQRWVPGMTTLPGRTARAPSLLRPLNNTSIAK